METRWRIEMLGELRVVGDDRVITRFRTHRTGALLAYLAYYQHRNHPRELLIELCWPEEAPESGWMKLRTALSSLRRQLEPPGTPRGSVILADRRSVRLNGAVVTTDVTQFEAALDSAGSAESGCAAEPEITAAIELYRGPLLPGYYEPWVLPEQQRLANRFHSAAQCLVRDLEQSGQMDRAVEVAGRAVAADPLHEEAHAELIRLSMRTGQRAAALRQYRELERLLREALDEAPSPETRQLLECARDHGGPGPKQEEPHLSSAMATHGSTAPAASPTRRSGPEPQPAALRGSAAARPGYLPVPVNRFFGREAEIVQVRELLLVDRARLVTLTGPGGSGKTRLSLEVATQVREAVDGAVWFVPLVDLADPRRIADTIRDAMRLPRIPNQPALERVVHALRDRRALLVLDNLEHLLDEGAAVIQALLEEAPLLHCLVTSRFVVDIAAEREVVVQPLPTPVSSEHEAQPGAAVGGPTREGGSSLPTAHWSLPTLLQCPSVALFVDRVQAVRPDFQVTAGNAAAVAEICRRLEGIPLAIELAAAQSRLLSPRQMVRQLEQRFDLLVSRRRDLHPRHQTLRATLQWSYGLLSPELQRFFRGLSVFRGGWTLEAAQFVADVPHALAPLGQLREASLVLCEEEAGEVRYRLLETVREFGWSELEKRGEAGETRRRHAEFFLRLAEEARIELRGSDQIAWYRRVEREHDNVRAVLAWSVETGEAESGLRLAGLLEWFWRTQGHLKEGREYIEPLLCLPAAQPRTRARVMALHTAGLIALDLGDHAAAQRLCEEGLSIAREIGKPASILSEAVGSLGCVLLRRRDLDGAEPLFQERLEIAREHGDQWGVACTLQDFGRVAWQRSDLERARAFFEDSLCLRRQRVDWCGIMNVLTDLGILAAWQRDFEAARACFREVLPIAQVLESIPNIARAYQNLGMAALDLGEYEEAALQFEQALPVFRAAGFRGPQFINTLNCLGESLRARGQHERAAISYEEALVVSREIGDSGSMGRSLNNRGLVANALGDFIRARHLFRECLEIHRRTDHRPGIRACFAGLAGTALGEHQPVRAAWLLGAASRQPEPTEPPLRPVDRREYDRYTEAARELLAEGAFAAAFAAGQAASMEEAIARALDRNASS